MAKNLVIVESPAKAKTIENYLGKDFVVKSSFGHVRDLASKGISVDVDNGFVPKYEVSSDKKSLVTELKKLAKTAEVVWLATDEDREGEAISWHLMEALKLDEKKTKRITFNEITKPAILKAIESPRSIDIDLVNAQQARRVLDRLVGFELSPVLWRKVKPSLSAGRVQSVAVRLIVEKEKDIKAFVPESYFGVKGLLQKTSGESFEVATSHQFKSEDEVTDYLKSVDEKELKVTDIEVKPGSRNPSAPFTTSTLQQEAGTKLGYSVSRTMSVAQKLYESGKITYMRTDSVNLSDQAINQAKNVVTELFGADHSNPKKYTTKNSSAQEAHEAIRPTDFSVQETGGDSSENALYKLIWRRAMASQMAAAKLEKTKVHVNNGGMSYDLVAQAEVITFPGFLQVYASASKERFLPPFSMGESLVVESIEGRQKFTKPSARYSEPSLVKKMEELGIGRPSTYAPTISTIQKRNYVEKTEEEGKEREVKVWTLDGNGLNSVTDTEIFGRDKGKLKPTDIGVVVNDFLIEHFADIMDYHFTADVESQFDSIAQGKESWQHMLEGFYKPFHKEVEDTMETAERASGERELGTDPKSGKKVIARIGRFGPMVQIGNTEDEEKPKFASLLKGQNLQDITLEEALELFKLPRVLGKNDAGDEIKANIGRFGPYVQVKKLFVSIPKEEDVMSIDLTRALELIKVKEEEEKNKTIHHFSDTLQVLNGRYGPYIKSGRKNYRIPKGEDPQAITEERCKELITEQDAKKKKKK